MPESGALRRWVERGWYARRARPYLLPLSVVYAAAMHARGWLYSTGTLPGRHAGVPTIVVGNLTAGGTGKTPLVIWLAGRLREAGRRPGVVLRGHGGTVTRPRLVRVDDDPLQVGDEALVHARRSACPVAVGAARVEAARLLVEAGCDFILADDGLQHLALRRDLEIIVIDGERGLGNGALLPAGPLRQKPDLRRTDALIVVNGRDRQAVVPPGAAALGMRLESRVLRNVATDQEEPALPLHGATVHAVAGIGNPGRFFALLRALGADPIEHPHPDHCRYSAADLAFADGRAIVMTEKDAVKCRQLARGRDDLHYLPVDAVLPGADARRLLDAVLASGRV